MAPEAKINELRAQCDEIDQTLMIAREKQRAIYNIAMELAVLGFPDESDKALDDLAQVDSMMRDMEMMSVSLNMELLLLSDQLLASLSESIVPFPYDSSQLPLTKEDSEEWSSRHRRQRGMQ
ncbi:hypothetical protein M406DRAFT_66675 [Cryphonectria parasitica EP155]|uniref:Uncharacterized protein n=1 Tax=Cryphonectria parasitica (strain ATCC 38755 / EP155) TaxID=660469 RepID=A0A9P4YB53_CRYP1|nr:uncharacterized protein M406DRAFT_66675 [Cryphonectria parasitica EP155]KAF3770257.1 hypothetical protein M406DRAFT_66675 [Cryphonectria parasitica EP155]